jgi:outer membrane lipoprotein-sorting protein
VRVGAAILVETALVIGALVLALTFSKGGEQPVSIVGGAFPLTSYYFESKVTSPTAQASDPYGVIRGWYQAPNKTRWEISCAGHPLCEGRSPRILLVTEEGFWFYEPETNSYSHEPLAEAELSGSPFPLLSNFQPGPLAPGLFDHRHAEGVPMKSETMLGVRVTNYADVLWVDEAHAFAFKQVGADAGGSRFVVQLTEVEYNPRLNPSVFEFQPPSGAKAAVSTPAPERAPFPTPGPNATRVSFDDFPRPAYLPPGGYSGGGSSFGSDSRSGLTYTESTYVAFGGGGRLTIRQERYTTPMPLPAGTPVAVGSTTGVRSDRGGETVVSFLRGDTIITIRSASLPLEELIRVGESMR